MKGWTLDTGIDFDRYLADTEDAAKVRCASVFLDEMLAAIENPPPNRSRYLPWDKTVGSFGIRPGEVTLWAGQNGSGKSLVTGMVAMDLIAQGDKVGILSFEMKPERSLQRMVRQFCGESLEVITKAELAEVYGYFEEFAKGWLYFYDQQGTVTQKRVLAVARYMAKELDIRHIFVDSLMKCVAGEDDFNGQKNFVDELCALARDLDIHIHLVHHVRKGAKDEDVPDKFAIKGSGSITDQVDNVVIVWRNKGKERAIAEGKEVDREQPDALLAVEKQRNGDEEERFRFWWDKRSAQLVDGDGRIKTFGRPA